MREPQGNRMAPLSIFISYAHEDEPFRQRLETNLSLLRRQRLISVAHDRQILAGEDWGQKIDEYLETASIILLLVSPDFLASDYCYDIEMQRALERHKCGEALVIPIILRPVDWTNAPFATLQCLPQDGKPISEWPDPDLAFRDIIRGIRHKVSQLCGIPAPGVREASERVGRTHRQRLIKRVHANWITGVLEQSLHQAILIELGLQEHPDALANPWHLTIQEMNQTFRQVPEGTHITHIYDGADGELLILGEPGGGKTTLLLTLARDLLRRAEEEQDHPVPVIFNLSSWAAKRQPLEVWLKEELHTKYRFTRNIATSWINEDQVILLLDGLDEVAPEARSACVQAINAYQRAHDLVSLVVCSRSGEYFAQAQRLLLQQAVMIQPLSAEQVEMYLSQLGEQGAGVRQLVQDDLWLREMMTTPLMLSILILAYQGRSAQDLPTAIPLSPAQFEQAVADLQTSYGRLLNAQSATPEARQALLAVQTASEQLLLVGRSASRRHLIFAIYTERILSRRRPGAYTPQQTISWLSWLGKTMILNDQMVFSVGMQLNKLPNPPTRLHELLGSLVLSLLNVLFIGLVAGLLILVLSFIQAGEGLSLWISVWLLFGVVCVVPFAACEMFLERVGKLPSGLAGMQVSGLVGWFVGGIVGLVSSVQLSAVLVGLLFGASTGGLLGTFVGGLIFKQISFRRAYSLNRVVLRWYLYRAGALPWNYRRFLDFAAERIFLRKVGQDYIFVHRLLLDYFVSLETRLSPERIRPQRNRMYNLLAEVYQMWRGLLR